MASGTPSVHFRIPVGDFFFLTPPPHLCLHYTTGRKIIRRPKKYEAEEYSSGGRIIIPDGRGWAEKSKKISQRQNMSHSADNTLILILIHCETIPYPYTLPKTLS